jgi:heme-degrading monooxygenase HmoA
MTHVRVWQFQPAPGREEEFRRAYAGDGPWARLFGRATGFVGTTLLGPAEPGGPWLTLDRWQSREAFDAFQREHGDVYRKLDAELEGVAGAETFIGAFEE